MSSHRERRRGRTHHRAETLILSVVVVALLGLSGALVLRLTASPAADAQSAKWASPVATSVQPPMAASPTVSAPASSSPVPVYAMTMKFPHSGPHTYDYATTTGPILGDSGPIRKFRVAIESNLKNIVTMQEFVAKINATLGDDRSWVGGGKYRLQQVPTTSAYAFTIYLVTSKTSSALCAPLYTGGYTSCRQGGRVVLNLDRWMTSVPYYVTAKMALDVYRTYMINHEVGHALGNGHELCPGKGKPAPVMEQQTLGLHGCKPNPWVYVNGARYDGPSGQY